jgi:hypothetical protein
MGLWDAIRGRSAPRTNDLDALFHVPSAAITLKTALGLAPTGTGGVCYRAAAGAAFAQVQSEVAALVDDTPDVPDDVVVSADDFGFTWLVVRREPGELGRVCTDLHAVNTTLQEQGFASGLLCSAVPFGSAAQRVVLVYLYKQGTFYPFAPREGRTRDNLLEVQVRDQLAGELPMEQELGRWMALWDAPVL